MGSLLRADWLRIRRRWDVWIIVLGIPVLTLLAYVAGASSSGNASVQFSGDVPADVKAQAVAQEAAMRAFQARSIWRIRGPRPVSVSRLTGAPRRLWLEGRTAC